MTNPKLTLSRLERYALRKAHPRKVLIDSAGFLWMAYFLWNQAMLEAILVMFAFSTVSLLLVKRVDPQAIAETFLGRIALLHLHPGNLGIQLVGFSLLLYGTWSHSTRVILLGISVVLVGHSFGWDRVSTKLATRTNMIT